MSLLPLASIVITNENFDKSLNYYLFLQHLNALKCSSTFELIFSPNFSNFSIMI